MMDAFDLASRLFGNSRAESRGDVSNSLDILTATGAGDSSDGAATVYLDADVTPADDYDGDDYAIGIPTSPNVIDGDGVLVGLTGSGPLKTPVVISNPGSGDRMQVQVDNAEELAEQAEAVAQEAAEDVEQVRQDVADFRDDVATTYATKVEREDGDDAVKTFITTNYTNSNDLATTYATKTLVSQTKDAIELAASQTYETQSDAAATYATKAALTVGLDGIRSEVAEDYQPKGDYATTASMNSAIQQSASSIESSVAATYETKTDAAATYATKTEVQQTASGLDTRITTATNTANSAKSAVDNLKVGGTNLASDVKLWYTRTASSVFTAQGITVRQIGDGLYSATGTTTGRGDIWFQRSIAPSLSRDHGDYVMSVYVESGTWPSENFFLQLAAYKSSDNTWNRNIRTANGSTSQAFTCEADYPRHFGFYSNTSGVEVNITFRLKLERGTLPTDWSPAPEDMATEADLQAEVTERQTLIRQFSGGVLAGYVGNAIAALVNAAGSFDVVRTAWSGGVPSILGTLARYAASGISLFDAAGNVLAEFASDHVRIGGAIPEDGSAVATVRFFDSDADKGAMVEGYVSNSYSPTDEDVGWGVQTQDTYTDLHTSTNDSDMEQVNGCAGTADVRLGQTTYWEDGPDGYYQTESTATLTATADSGTDPTQTAHASASLGVKAVTVNDSAEEAYITVNGNDVPMEQAIAVLSSPVTLFTGTYAQTHSTAVTLSETAANFSRIEFICENNDGERTSVTVTDPNGKNFNVVMVTIAGPTGTGTYAYMKAKSFSINGTSVTCRTYTYNGQTIYRHGSVTLRNGVAVAATQASEEIGIVKVLGWR